MGSFFLEAEAKLFCLLIAGFLWFFEQKSPQKKSMAQKHTYLFFVSSVLLSFLKDILDAFSAKVYIQKI